MSNLLLYGYIVGYDYTMTSLHINLVLDKKKTHNNVSLLFFNFLVDLIQ